MTLAEVWQFVADNLTTIKGLVGIIAVIGTGIWAVFKYFHKRGEKPKGTALTQTHSGHGDNVGGDKIIHTRDPQDRVTIDNLNTALELYQAQLEAKNVTQREQAQQINELRGALQLAQSIVRGGGALASAAQTLIDTFNAKPDDPALPAQLDALTARYENGPIQDMIALYLGRGAVSFYSDTQGALAAYTRVTELDPSHMAAHSWRGHLLRRLGELPAAQNAYEQVLSLADAQNDPNFKAAALGNLGIVARVRGDLDAAEGFYKQALELDKKLGRKEGMAINYGNLGIVARERGDLDAAEGFYTQSLKLQKKLGSKEGMANQYGNLGGLEHARGNPKAARDHLITARGLFATIGMPHMVDKTQGLLDDLGP